MLAAVAGDTALEFPSTCLAAWMVASLPTAYCLHKATGHSALLLLSSQDHLATNAGTMKAAALHKADTSEEQLVQKGRARQQFYQQHLV